MQNKQVIIIGVCVGILALAGIGFWVWQTQHSDGQKLGKVQSADSTKAIGPTQNVIPLNRAGETPEASGGLSVSSSNASSSVGQLDGRRRSNNALGSGSADSGPSTSSKPAIDPSTFSQYEKYKDNQGALFGDVQVGTGAELTANKKAAVYYRGWLTNGQMFDQSRTGSDGKTEAFIFTMGAHQVIPGWEQGLNGMKVGGVRLLIVPPAAGYGSTGQGSIPPNSVLVFQVQLAEVQ